MRVCFLIEMELLETFDSLGADDEQMEYVTVYASGKAGWATTDIDVAKKLAMGLSAGDEEETSMKVLLNSILDHIPPPIIAPIEEGTSDSDEPHFALAATTVGYDNFLGRLGI